MCTSPPSAEPSKAITSPWTRPLYATLCVSVSVCLSLIFSVSLCDSLLSFCLASFTPNGCSTNRSFLQNIAVASNPICRGGGDGMGIKTCTREEGGKQQEERERGAQTALQTIRACRTDFVRESNRCCFARDIFFGHMASARSRSDLQAPNTIFFREPDGCTQQRKRAYPILLVGPPQTLVVLLREEEEEDKEEAGEETSLMKK